MGDIVMPGFERTLKEQIRDVASMNSFSLTILSDARGTSRLKKICLEVDIVVHDCGFTIHRLISYRRTCNCPGLRYHKIHANKRDKWTRRYLQLGGAFDDAHTASLSR